MNKDTLTSKSLEQVPTPFLYINGQTVCDNINRLAKYAQDNHINVRPHTKTHKSQKLALMQLEAGAIGLTVAKAGEACVMAEINKTPLDILLAYPPVDKPRAVAVAQLAKKHTMRVALDSKQAVDSISQSAQQANTTVGVLIDIDLGMRRTGVQSSQEAAQLAGYVDTQSGLRLDGIFCYPGHIHEPAEKQTSKLNEISNLLTETINLFDKAGLCRAIVSAGSTPTLYQSHLLPQLTEIRPGTYIFNDMNTVRNNHCTLDDCAAKIITTVISSAIPGQVVIDAGSKTLTSDLCINHIDTGYGHVIEYPKAHITALSEEHGQINITNCATSPEIGERITIIPNHICPCINLQNNVWWDNGKGIVNYLSIDARGKLS